MKNLRNLAIAVFVLLSAAFTLYAIEKETRPAHEKNTSWQHSQSYNKPFYGRGKKHRGRFQRRNCRYRKHSPGKHRRGNRSKVKSNSLFKLFAIADELEINNTQLIQLRMAYEKSKPDKEYASKKAELKAQLKEKDIEFAKAREIITELGKMQTEKMLKKLEAKEELKKVLSPKQLEKLEKFSPGFSKHYHFKNFENFRRFKGMKKHSLKINEKLDENK